MRNALSLATILSTSMLLFGCSGGSNVDRAGGETTTSPVVSTTPIFNPAFRQLPVPTDLQFASETKVDGTMFVSDDTTNPVFVGIDALDGNSVISPFDIPFSGSVDSSSLDASNFVVVGTNVLPNPNQNVFLLPLTYPSGDALQAVDGEVPTFSEAATYAGAAATAQAALAAGDLATAQAAGSVLSGLVPPTARAEVLSLDGGSNNVLRITPLKPLLPETKYLVVLTDSILDGSGNPVAPSVQYKSIREGETIASLSGLREAIVNWEALAAGYFGFKSQVYASASAPFTGPSPDDIVLSLTFTTGGTDSVVKSAAAPESFFEKSISTSYKKDAITKLISGVYSLSGPDDSLGVTDGAINSTLVALLTSETLPGPTANPLYNATIAGAIAAGADYSTIAADASAAHIMQRAAAEAAIAIHDSGAAAGGDVEPFVDIATEALGTVSALATGAGVLPTQLFSTIPAERETSFFRVDQANALNPSLAETAKVYQGEITLPSFQQVPVDSGAAVVQSTWQADATIGAVIDAGSGNAAGTTPPSTAITYRYPFPAKQADVTVPLLAVTPDEAIPGVDKPENGWPVVIFVHGIGQDRSNAMPMGGQLASLCLAFPLPCYATIAIDQPLHGVVPEGSSVPGLISATNPNAALTPNLPADSPATPSAALTERHFDYSDDPLNPTGVPQPMSYGEGAEFGGSGSLFINLTNFANVRDNLRQMNLDLMNLVASIDAMDVDGDGVPGDLDSNNIYLVGHSLGGISGTPFVAVNNSEAVQSSLLSNQPMVKAAAIMKAGGGIPRLLVNSPRFGPSILGGLDAASGGVLTLGSTSLETYLSVFQGILDSADPINYAASLSDDAASDTGTGILVTEVIGDGVSNLPDLVIPNGADADVWGEQNAPLNEGDAGAPLAGTEPLIELFGAVKSSAADSSDGDAAVLVTRFTDGNHATPVSGNDLRDPELADYADPANLEVFAELISEIGTFFALSGVVDGSIVTNTGVVEDAD